MAVRAAGSDMGALYDEHAFNVKVDKRGKRGGNREGEVDLWE